MTPTSIVVAGVVTVALTIKSRQFGPMGITDHGPPIAGRPMTGSVMRVVEG